MQHSQSSDIQIKKPDMRFALVQELRGFAALWVVFFHASGGGHLRAVESYLPAVINTIVFKAGHYGVAVFFALSGFVIAHSLRKTNASLKEFGRFVVKRSIRLDPPYWLSIAAIIMLGYLSSVLGDRPFSGFTAGDIAAHVIYAQVILGIPEINTVYWTLTYEIQFYLFFAFALMGSMVLAHRTGSIIWITGAWILFDVLALASALNTLTFLPEGIFANLWASFYVGVLAYRSQKSLQAQTVFVLLLVVMFVYPAVDNFSRLSAATALLLAYTLHTGQIFSGLGWHWLQAVGLISYSLYLLHNPITGMVGFAVEHTLGSGFVAASIGFVAIVGASLTGAFIFWWAVEKPAHRLSQTIRWGDR